MEAEPRYVELSVAEVLPCTGRDLLCSARAKYGYVSVWIYKVLFGFDMYSDGAVEFSLLKWRQSKVVVVGPEEI